MNTVFVNTHDNKISITKTSAETMALYTKPRSAISDKFENAKPVDYEVAHMQPELLRYTSRSYNEVLAKMPVGTDIRNDGVYHTAHLHYIAMPGSLLEVVSTYYKKELSEIQRKKTDVENDLAASKRECDTVNRKLTEMIIKNESLLDTITEKNKIIDSGFYNATRKIKNFFKRCG